MSESHKKRWTLVDHLRGLGIEPEAPTHPAWEDLGNLWGSDFKQEKTLTRSMLGKMNAMSLAAAPLAITLYKWAGQNNIELEPFKGSVNCDTRVRQAMREYAAARIKASNGWFQDLEDLVCCHIEQAPLPLSFKTFLDHTFNQEPDVSNSLTAWLAPVTGKLPAISSWSTMSKSLNDNYSLKSEDIQVFSGSLNQNGYHWSGHLRMELVLAAWLDRELRYLEMPLYNHLQNISMDAPDNVTAVFWIVATQRIEMDPEKAESTMLKEWMAQYPHYSVFLQEKRSLIEGLIGNDPVVCGKMLHDLWQQRHVTAPERPSLVGLLEP